MDQLQPPPDRVQDNLPRPPVKIILSPIILTQQAKAALLCLRGLTSQNRQIHYQFMLNSDRFTGFRSRAGVPLEPITVTFKTR